MGNALAQIRALVAATGLLGQAARGDQRRVGRIALDDAEPGANAAAAALGLAEIDVLLARERRLARLSATGAGTIAPPPPAPVARISAGMRRMAHREKRQETSQRHRDIAARCPL